MEGRQGRLMLALAVALVAMVGLIVFVEAPDDEPPGMPAWEDAFPDAQGADVVRLELAGADGARVVLERDGAGWAISEPIDQPADPGRAQAAATAVARASVGEPFARTDGAPYGLDRPSLTVVATTASGQALSLTLGDDTPSGSGTYVRDGAGRMRATRTQLSATLPLDPDAWRSKVVVQAPRSGVRRVEIRSSTGERRVLERDGGAWWLTRADGRHRAGENAVDQLIEALNELRVERFLDGPRAGAAGTVIRLTVGEGEPIEVVIGDGDGGVRLVQGPLLDGPAQATASAVLAELAPGALLGTVLMPVQMATLDHIDLALGERRLDATREGADWADPRAEAVLGALLAARVRRGDATPPPTGAPWGHIRLAAAAGRDEVVTLHQAVEGGRVATDGGAPFVVPDGVIAALSTAAGPEG